MMKRLREARIFGSGIWKGRELKEGQARDLGRRRRLGEISRALMMGKGLNTFCQCQGVQGKMEGRKFLNLWPQAMYRDQGTQLRNGSVLRVSIQTS